MDHFHSKVTYKDNIIPGSTKGKPVCSTLFEFSEPAGCGETPYISL